MLPAFPVRVACESLADPNLAQDNDKLLNGMRASLDIYYNYTYDSLAPHPHTLTSLHDRHEEKCFNIADAPEAFKARLGATPSSIAHSVRGPDACVGDWGYQWCTEMVQPFTQGTEKV